MDIRAAVKMKNKKFKDINELSEILVKTIEKSKIPYKHFLKALNRIGEVTCLSMANKEKCKDE